ncbi:MAG: hypothetical protein JXP34_03330 [Planctomycetes bacterium]|nr:hypothetical protein [Planctomycetota bacterium]
MDRKLTHLFGTAAILALSLPLEAAVERDVRVFDVSILAAPPGARRPALVFPGSILIQGPDDEGEDGSPLEGGSVLQAYYGSYLGLIEKIPSLIAEDSWLNKRNELHLAPDKLTVVQTPEVLRHIEAYLGALLALRTRRIEVQIAIVPPSALDRAAGARRDADPPWLPGRVIDEAVLAAGDDALVHRTVVDEGEALGVSPVSRTAFVQDIEVNQTGVSPVENPVISLLRGDLTMQARAWTTPLEGWYEFELRLLRSHEEPGARRATPSGDIDLTQGAAVLLACDSPIPSEKTIVLGDLRWPEKEPAPLAVLVRLRPAPGLPARADCGVRILEAGLLARNWPRSTVASDEESHPRVALAGIDADVEGDPLYTDDELIEMARESVPADLRSDPRLRIEASHSRLAVTVIGDRAATARAAHAVQARLALLFEARAKAAEMRLWLASIDAEALAGIADPAAGAALLVPDWRAAIDPSRGAAIRLTGFADRLIRFGAARGRSYLADVEHVSGGTEKIITEAADPILGWGGTGLELRAHVRAVPGRPWVQLGVHGDAAQTTFGRTASLCADKRVEVDEEGGIRAIGQTIDIDLPEQTAQTWKHYVTVPAGRACLLATAPDPADPKRIQILVAEGRVLPLRAE